MHVLELLLDTSLAHSLVPELKDPLLFFLFLEITGTVSLVKEKSSLM